MPIATRLTNAGTLLVNGSFDENTSISPSQFRTTSNTVYAGTLDEISFVPGSWALTGSQGVTVGNSSAFALPGDFTVEFFFYLSSVPAGEIDFWESQTNTTFRILKRGSSSGLSYDAYGGTSYLIVADASIPTNAWNHVAVSRTGSTVQAYFNGTRTINQTDATSFGAPTANYSVGCRATGVNGLNGSISNFRLVKGAGIYTGATIPVPTAPLGAVSGTQLLLTTPNTGGAFFDYSTNNFTVTRVGAPSSASTSPFTVNTPQRSTGTGVLQVKNIFDEFTGAPVVDANLMVWVDAGQTTSYSGSGATWTDLSSNAKNYTLTNSPTFNSITGGGVITFAGASSQYATTATTLFNSTTTNTYSINIWVFPTSAGQIVSVDGQSTPNTSYHYTAIEITAGGVIYFGQWAPNIATIATSAQSLNAWYNLVITYNGTTATAYVNGTSVGSSAIAWSAPGASTFFALMSQDSTNMTGTTAYASGSIGAFMVYNRALTADEVTTNFNALRNRYGR
jgi:hypothetical protein